MLGIPWNPLRAILLSSLGSLLPPPRPTRKVPVFMMLPLDTALPRPKIPLPALKKLLERLSKLGAEGVMIDIWWGLCEKTPSNYDFTQYMTILQSVKDAGLKVQAVMSFHSCGGNIGDTTNIPLPEWVIKSGDEFGAWFQDRSGGYLNREYLSFGVDDIEFLPSATGKRTPVSAYSEFVAAFMKAVDNAGLKDILVEIQVGLGPCGELRYPSYPGRKWKFPGIGEFQCYDKHLMKSLARISGESGETVLPPYGGEYNDKPWNTEFFNYDRKTEAGKLFLDWYSSQLVRHGDAVLTGVKRVTDTKVAVKVSGIHWWYHHTSRAAESTTGYINSRGSTYRDIAALCSRYDAVLDFTCLEMRSIDQPLWARCGPRQLVREVFAAAYECGVGVAGENAIERWNWKAFRQVIKAFRRSKARGVGYTHLRLSDEISEKGWHNFEKFVSRMNEI